MNSVASPAKSLRWLAHPLFRWGSLILGAVAFSVLAFAFFGVSLLERIGLPHETCYLLDPSLISLHVTTDLLIGLAYVSIALTLGFLVYRASRGIPFNGIFLAFGLFIVSCGFSHFMEVWVIWEPVYWLSGYVKVVTVVASLATAVALFPLVPRVFALIETARASDRRRGEIEQLNGELQRFNYSVAHDLRAPLRGITGFGEALREDCGNELSPRAQRYLEHIQHSAAQMDTLISSLLHYASIGRQAMTLAPVPLHVPIQSALSMLSAEIERRGATVRVPEQLPTVRGDTVLLQVVFQNLVGNALKFVAPGVSPEVEITATIDADKGIVRVNVTDNGLGIPPDARGKVFQMFERYHTEAAGTGIGLALVHRSIERMRGKIGIDSAPTGTGTRFWIDLPAA